MSDFSQASPTGNGVYPFRSADAVLEVLSSRRRRKILAILTENRKAISERELAARVVVRAEETSPMNACNEEHRQVYTSLHHVHLPKLQDANLIVRDADRREVSPTDHPLFRTDVFDAVVRNRSTSPDALDSVLSVLAHERRRTTLAALQTAGRPLAEAEVGERVAVRESCSSTDDLVRILRNLRHVHLPALTRADLVKHDAESRMVSYDGHPDIDDRRFVNSFGYSRPETGEARVREESP